MSGLFVTATGTEVGKTYIAAALIRAGRRAGYAMSALKPVLTGFDEAGSAESDAAVLLDALGLHASPDAIAEVAPWRFAAPLAPSMAAPLEGRALDLAEIVAACRATLHPSRLTVVEGIGGVMVPLDNRHTVLDLIAALALPVVLVTASAIGALSHCLTACEALRMRGCAPCLIVLNESAGSRVPLAATRDTLAQFCSPTPIAIVPRDATPADEDALLQALLVASGLRPSRTPQTAA